MTELNPFLTDGTVESDDVNSFEDHGYNHGPAQSGTQANYGNRVVQIQDIDSRERKLEQREAALKQREQQLEARERQAKANGASASSEPPNWPCEAYALARHDIDADIPPTVQWLVKRFYYICLSLWIILIFNWFIVAISWWTSDTDTSSKDALWATIYLVAGVPGSWKLWYYQLYNALKKDSSRHWVVCLVNLCIHVLFCALMSIGFPDWGSAGLWEMLALFAKGKGVLGAMALICTAMWISMVLTSVFYLKRAYNVWRGSGNPEVLRREVAGAVVTHALATSTEESSRARQQPKEQEEDPFV